MPDIIAEHAHQTRGRQIRRGISWNAANLVVNKGMSILVRLLLARLLVPEHFGLIAMIVVVIGFVQIFIDFGLKSALVQRAQDADSRVRYDTVFWLLFAGGIGWTLVFMFAGIPLMIWFYDEPQLRNIAMVMGVSLLIHSIAIVPEVRLTRRMRFKSLVMAEAIANVAAAGIAIALAIGGAGVWALAAQMLSSVGLRTAMIWRFTPWRPRFRFSWSSLWDVAGFSGWMLGNHVVYYLRKNLDLALIGALLGAAALGTYTLAYMLTETMRAQITNAVNTVMFPSYSRVQKDKAEVCRLYLGVVRYTTLVVFPLAAVLILFAEQLVLLGFGAIWKDAIVPIQILALASAIFALSGDPSAVLRGLGKPNIAFHISLWNTLIVGVPALIFGTMVYGLTGAAWAVVLHYSTSRIISQIYLRRLIPVTEAAVLIAALPALGLTIGFVMMASFIAPFEG